MTLTGCIARDSDIHTEICPEVDLRIDSPDADDIDNDTGEPTPPKKQPRLNPVKALMKIFSMREAPSVQEIKLAEGSSAVSFTDCTLEGAAL